MQPQSLDENPVEGERRRGQRLFQRDLPGGGYVSIERSDSDAGALRLVIERRADRARRDGHPAPVIVEDPGLGFAELYQTACDNTAIARTLIRLSRAD